MTRNELLRHVRQAVRALQPRMGMEEWVIKVDLSDAPDDNPEYLAVTVWVSFPRNALMIFNTVWLNATPVERGVLQWHNYAGVSGPTLLETVAHELLHLVEAECGARMLRSQAREALLRSVSPDALATFDAGTSAAWERFIDYVAAIVVAKGAE